MNNCFSICTRSDLNWIRKETVKETIRLIHGWIHGLTCSRKQEIHNSWIFAVFSNMANLSFNFLWALALMIEKINVESLNNSPFREETQSFICFCQLCTVNETVFFYRFLQMLSTAATIEVRVHYLQCSVPCHVNLLARIVFENACFPFFLHKLTSFFTLNGRKDTCRTI